MVSRDIQALSLQTIQALSLQTIQVVLVDILLRGTIVNIDSCYSSTSICLKQIQVRRYTLYNVQSTLYNVH